MCFRSKAYVSLTQIQAEASFKSQPVLTRKCQFSGERNRGKVHFQPLLNEVLQIWVCPPGQATRPVNLNAKRIKDNNFAGYHFHHGLQSLESPFPPTDQAPASVYQAVGSHVSGQHDSSLRLNCHKQCLPDCAGISLSIQQDTVQVDPNIECSEPALSRIAAQEILRRGGFERLSVS